MTRSSGVSSGGPNARSSGCPPDPKIRSTAPSKAGSRYSRSKSDATAWKRSSAPFCPCRTSVRLSKTPSPPPGAGAQRQRKWLLRHLPLRDRFMDASRLPHRQSLLSKSSCLPHNIHFVEQSYDYPTRAIVWTNFRRHTILTFSVCGCFTKRRKQWVAFTNVFSASSPVPLHGCCSFC